MKLRDYQSNIKEKLESKEFTRFLLAWPRRAGKDFLAIQLCMDRCREKKSVVYYVFPTWRIARCIMPEWKFIQFYNGSSIRIIGDNDPKKLELGFPDLCIFSEYSMINPLLSSSVYEQCNEGGGDAIFIGTPHLSPDDPMRMLYNKVKDDKNWYIEALTVDDTKHLPENYIKDEIENGLLSEEIKLREFYPSF